MASIFEEHVVRPLKLNYEDIKSSVSNWWNNGDGKYIRWITEDLKNKFLGPAEFAAETMTPVYSDVKASSDILNNGVNTVLHAVNTSKDYNGNVDWRKLLTSGDFYSGVGQTAISPFVGGMFLLMPDQLDYGLKAALKGENAYRMLQAANQTMDAVYKARKAAQQSLKAALKAATQARKKIGISAQDRAYSDIISTDTYTLDPKISLAFDLIASTNLEKTTDNFINRMYLVAVLSGDKLLLEIFKSKESYEAFLKKLSPESTEDQIKIGMEMFKKANPKLVEKLEEDEIRNLYTQSPFGKAFAASFGNDTLKVYFYPFEDKLFDATDPITNGIFLFQDLEKYVNESKRISDKVVSEETKNHEALHWVQLFLLKLNGKTTEELALDLLQKAGLTVDDFFINNPKTYGLSYWRKFNLEAFNKFYGILPNWRDDPLHIFKMGFDRYGEFKTYFTKYAMTDILARMSQLKNILGKSFNSDITRDELNWFFSRYSKAIFDNNIVDLSSLIKDPEKFLQFVNSPEVKKIIGAVSIPVTVLGPGLGVYKNEEDIPRYTFYKNGGIINYLNLF